jgi:uncharacterized membrane protein YfcA
LLGLFVGFSSAALGIGGGITMVPALTILFKLNIKKAVGISLVTIVPVALVGAVTYFILESSYIRIFVALLIIVGSVVGAKYGASIANKISSSFLSKLFSILLFIVGLKLTGIIDIPIGANSNLAINPLLIVLGLFAGFSSAMFGIGGGVIMVPVLNLFFGLTIHESIATSLTVIIPTTIAGAFFHNKINEISKSEITYLIPTALIGAAVGALTASILPEITLKFLFGLFLIICSFIIFFQKKKLAEKSK